MQAEQISDRSESNEIDNKYQVIIYKQRNAVINDKEKVEEQSGPLKINVPMNQRRRFGEGSLHDDQKEKEFDQWNMTGEELDHKIALEVQE